jgi:hypothetical protein
MAQPLAAAQHLRFRVSALVLTATNAGDSLAWRTCSFPRARDAPPHSVDVHDGGAEPRGGAARPRGRAVVRRALRATWTLEDLRPRRPGGVLVALTTLVAAAYLTEPRVQSAARLPGPAAGVRGYPDAAASELHDLVRPVREHWRAVRE